jgi:DNA-binding response OmpR family regulator
MVRWPLEVDRRRQLQALAAPRLLLLEDGVAPPEDGDCLEDWQRLPASEDDVRARVAALLVRARAHGSLQPEIDNDGVVRFRGSWVHLPPVEARLFAALLERFGAVVSRAAMHRAGWSSEELSANALDVRMGRLRRRLAPLGLTVRTVRSRGFLLEQASGSRQDCVREA